MARVNPFAWGKFSDITAKNINEAGNLLGSVLGKLALS